MKTKNKLKLILKAILLYSTFIFCTFSLMAIDDIYDKGFFLIDVIICVALIYGCEKYITKEDVDILSFRKKH